MKTLNIAALASLVLFSTARIAGATAEICGDGIDNNSNGYADEGCFADAVGICENPMSCATTGNIGPKSGAFVYELAPDINPATPFGPQLQFKRTYMSLYAPPATNYRTSMGTRWGNNWQSWLDKSGTSAIVHLVTGRDVKFTFSNTSGGFDYYTPQAGFHVQYLRQATTSPNNWEMKTLIGAVYKYNWASPVGKLIEVDDTLVTPNKLTIVYFTSGTNNGQISTITDASGHKRLSFVYTTGRVTTVNYQTGSGTTWTTRVALTITYTSTNPTTIKIAGTTIQTNVYTSNYLTSIQDANSNHIIDVNYLSATAGKTASVTTGEGGIGFDYSSANTQCSGQTVLFFNLANATSCNVDADCGVNPPYKCGGKTGTGTTGKCYRAARCLTTSSPSEDLITTVTPVTPCSGSCAPTAQYSWNTTTLDLKGVKLADGNWTSYQRNTNGLVTMMAEGDADDDPTNGGGVDTWFFYGNSSFPGRITEKRHTSNITGVSGGCDGSTSTACMRTKYTWNADGLLGSVENDGFTIVSSLATTSFAYTTANTYDTVGRLTNIDGPLAGANDATVYTFWSSSDVLKDGYLHEIKRKKDTTNFVTTTLDVYDYFGNAGTTLDPDTTPTCRTWDSNRNYLSQVREAMAGQADCTTSNGADLTTSFVRDSWLRLTKTTRPLGDCEHKEYDSFGRLTNTKLRDDCVAANTGNTMVESYDANGLHIKTELKDSSGTVTRRLENTYLDGGQVDGVINPVSPTYSRNFTYYSDGQHDLTTFENGIGKTEQFWDAENREIHRDRYESSSVSDRWTFDYPNGNSNPTRNPEKVTDPASKLVTTTLDDVGRKNVVVSPDSGTTIYVYDAASRLITLVEGYSPLGSTATHNFTYDNIGRKLTEDYGTESCSGSSPVEVQYTYDAIGVSCPTGALCTNLNGRLAYVKQVLMCTTSAPFHLDQETFNGYDAAGRLVSEEIDDPSPRAVQQNYAYDKNGNVILVTAPSGASMAYTFGGAGNSDTNLVTTLARSVSGTPTNLLTGILWAPFGPVTQYDQANTIGGSAIRATLAWNLAYRATQIKYAGGGTGETQIDYSEDAKGRYIQKLYSNVFGGVQSDYLTYDWFDRPTCDASISGTCPTSGTNLKSGVAYNSSNDRSSINHHDTFSGDVAYSVTYNTSSDQIATYRANSTITYGWDGRGNRAYEDDQTSTVDRRDYTYEGRRRVRTITGQFPRNAFFGLTWDTIVITYAYDYRDRVVFRDWYDAAAGWESQTFYNWDMNDRLIEIKFVPAISDQTTYTVYDFYWLGARPVATWATDFPSATTSRYFSHADESDRILEVYSWPGSGNASNVWANNPDIYGWDVRVNGVGFFEPLALDGAVYDDGTTAYFSATVGDRPWLLIDHGVHFDPMTETSLQQVTGWPNEPYTRDAHQPERVAPLMQGGGIQISAASMSTDGSIRPPKGVPKPVYVDYLNVPVDWITYGHYSCAADATSASDAVANIGTHGQVSSAASSSLASVAVASVGAHGQLLQCVNGTHRVGFQELYPVWETVRCFNNCDLPPDCIVTSQDKYNGLAVPDPSQSGDYVSAPSAKTLECF